jgi:hypothetical protein
MSSKIISLGKELKVNKIEVNVLEWGKNGRHLESFKNLEFVKSLVGKKVRLCEVREGHEYRGVIDSLFWDKENNEHCFDIISDNDSEEGGYLNIWEIDYFEELK